MLAGLWSNVKPENNGCNTSVIVTSPGNHPGAVPAPQTLTATQRAPSLAQKRDARVLRAPPELTLLIDSKLGINRSADGSVFTYPLEPALMVPFDAEPALRVLEANVFYTSPNVSAAKSNNKLKFSVITSGTVTGGDVSTADHTITFDGGLYSLADINAELADYLESTSAIADAALSFVGHGPTQTVFRNTRNADWDAEAATYGVIRRFSESDSIASLLGFAVTDLTHEISEGGKHKYFRSPSPANFDAVSLYLLKCSVLSGHNYDASGSGGGQVACAITPDVRPGNLVQYRPLIPLPCQAHALKGNRKSSIRFTMTDNNDESVVLNEAYTARILVSW